MNEEVFTKDVAKDLKEVLDQWIEALEEMNVTDVSLEKLRDSVSGLLFDASDIIEDKLEELENF